MELRQLNAENFRNIPLVSLRFEGASTFLLGRNGQGKSNLLEAAGLITALRSFRTSETRAMVRYGEKQARVYYVCEREGEGTSEITLTLSGGKKQVSCDDEQVHRLGDFLGRFPSVTLAAEDIQLVRGSPGLRRRFLDITLSATSTDYFEALRRYHRALKERNQLLKLRSPREAELLAFDKALAPAAVTVCRFRAEALAKLNTQLAEAYATVSESAETPELRYRANAEWSDEEAVLRALHDDRSADLALKTTRHGPHRDDLGFVLAGRAAREYASDGQQRSYVIALRLAQMVCFQKASGVAPVVLADDVLGELDPQRRRAFWRAVSPDQQVIATGTEPPPGDERDWSVLEVSAGSFQPHTEA